jgi:hypothetical protein
MIPNPVRGDIAAIQRRHNLSVSANGNPANAGPTEDTMLRILTIAALAAAALAATTPAHAALSANALVSNAFSNALVSNALATTGSAIDDLDGVAVEAVSLPHGARR